MEITGTLYFGRNEGNGFSAPVFTTSFVDWLKDRFDGRESNGAVWIKVKSGQDGVAELVSRIRSDAGVLPSCSWQLAYSKRDVANARFLSVSTHTQMADLADDPTRETVSVKGNAKLKSPRPIGQIFAFPGALAVNSETKELLENSFLKGVGFAPVDIVGRRPEHHDIWMIEPKVMLPPSPMSLKNPFGGPFDGDFTTGCQYLQPYPNIELSYYAASLESMEPFDIAGTRERIGNYVGGTFRHIIVSQQFRKWINDAKIRGLRYTPVRVLGSDDPVFRDPFDQLLRSV
jgi:hypothetical protein